MNQAMPEKDMIGALIELDFRTIMELWPETDAVALLVASIKTEAMLNADIGPVQQLI